MAQQLGNVAVESIVKIKLNDGEFHDFIVVHQGLPSSSYDSSCNGTWVLQKGLSLQRQLSANDSNNYKNSDINEYLNGTFLNTVIVDDYIRNAIKQVKIPYVNGNGNTGVLSTGSNGLSCRVFCLSGIEVGFNTNTFLPYDGAKLSYFTSGYSGEANEKRLAYLGDSPEGWALRTPYMESSSVCWSVSNEGDTYNNGANKSICIRPAFVLLPTLYVDDSGKIFDNTPPTAPTNITVPESGNKGGNVAVSWSASTDQDDNLSGYTLQRSVNSGGFTQVYQGANTSYTDTAPTNADTLQYRVQAYDTEGTTSGWTTSNQFPVYGVPALTVPQMVMQGQQATINWASIEGADSYTLQRKSSSDGDWTQVYSGAATTFSETVGTWTSLQYRVQAVFDGTPGGWATSGDIQIVSASALVISGQDGDLGTLTNDVPYSISSDQANPTINVTVEVNGGEYASFQATSGQTYKVGVLDLPTGTGSIVITASAEVSDNPVTVTRTWTYSKTAQTFPNSGSVTTLTQENKVVYPETLTEAVRTSMTPWGGNLSTALNLLKNAALFNQTKTPKYNKVTIDLSKLTQTDAQNGKIINLPYKGAMTPHRVVHIGKPDSELYDSSCNGVWLLREDIVELGDWQATNVNTGFPNSTIANAMDGYFNNYDISVQASIKSANIPYCVGGGSLDVTTTTKKIFPASIKELGADSGTNNYPEDGAPLQYFITHPDALVANFNGTPTNYWTRTPDDRFSTWIYYISSGGGVGGDPAGNALGYRHLLIMDTAFSATYYVGQNGTIHDAQEYEEAGTWSDVWGNAIPAIKIETGAYVGTGTSGSSNPNTLTFPFAPKIVFIAMQDGSQGISGRIFQSFPWIYGTNQGVVSYGEDQIEIGINNLSWDGTTLKWYSSAGNLVGADYQLNKNGVTYLYVVIG